MTTRRITDSSIGAGGGGAVVRFQDDEPTAIRPGELWVESDGVSSLINANDYLSKADAVAEYLTKLSASATYLTQASASALYAPSASPTFTGTVNLPATTNYDGSLLSATFGSKLTYPSGGSDGDALLKSGTAAAWGAAGGLTLVTAQSFTAVSSVQLDNIFSSTYLKYRLLMRITSATNGATLLLRSRSGGTTGTSNYVRFLWGATDTSPSPAGTYGVSQGSVSLHTLDSGRNYAVIEILDPFASSGFVLGLSMGGYASSGRLATVSGAFNLTADGIDLSVSSGNMTGSIRVYGYRS